MTTPNEKNARHRIHWPTLAWEEGSPRDHSMQDQLLWLGDETIQRDLPNVYSLLVIRHGTIVFEQYYQEHDAASLFDIRSVMKSFVSALVGIAAKEQQILSLDQKIFSYFPEHRTANMDLRKAAMTIRDLLMMKSGLAWDEESGFAELYSSADWIQYILNLPMQAEPGSVFSYNSGASHILSELIHRATGVTALEYAQKRLFLPLGIGKHQWAADPMGISLGFAGLSLMARDVAKLGLLYARHGIWEGRPLLTPEYVRDSTTTWSPGGFPEEAEYGYHWWVLPSDPHPAYFAAGYGGQYLWVVPDLDLIVVITARFELPPWRTQDHRFLITDFIVASAQSDNT